jgi:hypothetical protein
LLLQVDAIMRTDSTRRRWPLDMLELPVVPLPLVAVPADDVEPVLGVPLVLELLDSRLPLISTSWPTCGRSSLALPSS